MKKNHMRLTFDGRSENESFARAAVSAFAAQLSPTLEEIADIKTAVSEAVTNAIVHGYSGGLGEVTIDTTIEKRVENGEVSGALTVIVMDQGCGIVDVAQAMEPFYTTQPELERAGMGFAVMRTFMDDLEVDSKLGRGTRVTLRKRMRHACDV